jgi:hypothetical protein
MSVDRSLDLEVDLDENRVDATIVERRELTVDGLFRDGELRLWEDERGWSGYLREETDDGVAYFHVNTSHREDSWTDVIRVGERAVRVAIEEHIWDPDAGSPGSFERRCSPP